jgi:chromosome segregation ATPase
MDVEQNVVEQNVSTESEDFLNKANNTQKTFGHHKLQVQIDELQAELQKSKSQVKEQDTKITLFKKTIVTLQTQLQEKISQMNTRTNADATQNSTITKLNDKIKTHLDQNIDLQKQVNELTDKVNQLTVELSTVAQEKNTLSEKFIDMKKRCTLLEGSCQDHVQDLDHKVEMISKLQNEKDLEESLKNKMTSEMSNMQSEIENLKTINDLKDREFKRVFHELTELKKVQARARGVEIQEQQVHQTQPSHADKPKEKIVGSNRRGLPIAGARTLATSKRQ